MIHFVGAGPGAPDLITLRGAELLKTAGVVIYAWNAPTPSCGTLATAMPPPAGSSRMSESRTTPPP